MNFHDSVLTEGDLKRDTWFALRGDPVVQIPANVATQFRIVPEQAMTLSVINPSSGRHILVRIEQGGTGYAVTLDPIIVSGVVAISTVAGSTTWFELVWNEETLYWDVIPWLTAYSAGLLYLTPAAAALLYQPADPQLDTWAGITPTATGTSLVTAASAAAARAVLGVSGLAYVNTSVPGGNTVANTGTETAFDSKFTVSANALVAGSIIRVRMWGTYGTAALPVTLRGRFKIGGTTVLDTGELTAVLNLSNLGWTADIEIAVQTIGATASFEIQGFLQFATAATTGLSVNAINTAAVTVDTTASQEFKFTADWSGADAANTITLRILSAEIVNP